MATLIVPHNHQWSQANGESAPVASSPISSVDENRVKDSIASLQQTEKVLLLLGGRALYGRRLEAAGRIARATGCDVACETFPARLERWQGRQTVIRLPYFPKIAQQYLGAYATVILVGTKPPVTFFGYDGVPSLLIDPLINVVNLAGPEENADGSAAYTVQALWNQAREGLDVITVICANHNYKIIEMELANSGVKKMGPNARALTSLDPLDWTCLAKGFGVPACAVDTVEEFTDAFFQAISEPGPMLIQANI